MAAFLVLAVGAFFWLRLNEGQLRLILRATGILPPDLLCPFGRSASGSRRNAATSLVIGIAFLLVLNPEVRIALLFVDAIGLELLLLLVAYQLRSTREVLRHVGATLRYLSSGKPLPLCIPTAGQLRNEPAFAASGLVWPFAALSIAFGTGP